MRSATHCLLVAAALCTTVAATRPARAQRAASVHERSLGVGAVLGAGGDVDFDGRGRFDDDLLATPGLRVHWDKLLKARNKGRVVLGGSLGVFGRVSFWEPASPADRSSLFDVALRGRFLIGFRDFLFYFGPALGPTILSILNDDYRADERVRPGVNFTFVALGFEWWWNRDHALFTEIGYMGHWLFHDRTFRLNQATLDFGINFGR